MRAPSQKRLLAEFHNLTPEAARLIRKIAHATDSGEELKAVIEASCKGTADYVRRMHSSPYDSQIWRVTVAMHAIDVLLETSGVEALGPPRRGDYAPPYEYCNAGDPYVATLVYKRAADTLMISGWGAIAEHDRKLATDENTGEYLHKED